MRGVGLWEPRDSEGRTLRDTRVCVRRETRVCVRRETLAEQRDSEEDRTVVN